MRKLLLSAGFALAGLWVAGGAFAADSSPGEPGENEGAYLDAPYTDLVHPTDSSLSASDDKSVSPPSRSDVEKVISFQTPVKSQASRGTCTFFSTTAVLESELVRYKSAPKDLSLSEQWLAYVIGRTKTQDGSHSNDNFNLLAYYGTVEQSLMPYEGDEWKTVSDNATSQLRCGSVPASALASCLVSHYDPRFLTEDDASLKAQNPEFFNIRNRARQFRSQYLASSLNWHATNYAVKSTGDIKSLLSQNVPLTLDVEFFYGAWNHALADTYGIKRDLDAWGKGVIGYPANGSVDRAVSPKHGSAHSVVIVGYDDNVEVTTRVLMSNGTWQTFTYRGVYYIKNSWGTGSFGAHFEANSVGHPGYGMITQKYANERGSFYRLPIQ